MIGCLLLAACDAAEQRAPPGAAADAVPPAVAETPAGVQVSPAVAPGVPAPSRWSPLARDSLHDPTNPALALLQEPAEALSVLPPAREGNQVDWVAALRQGQIEPRTNIYPETKANLLDLDIIFEETAGMPPVRFPHRAHTEWLDCSNCHDALFVAKRGANAISMADILEGRYCGQCHGAVSFPLTQCQRCHSVPRGSR